MIFEAVSLFGFACFWAGIYVGNSFSKDKEEKVSSYTQNILDLISVNPDQWSLESQNGWRKCLVYKKDNNVKVVINCLTEENKLVPVRSVKPGEYVFSKEESIAISKAFHEIDKQKKSSQVLDIFMDELG